MGLDMYLYKKTYVKNWAFEGPEEKKQVTVKKGGKSIRHIKPKRINFIVEEVSYWRKSNQIHQWFVENVQKGVDDCGEHYLDSNKLKELLNECNAVIKSPSDASTILPTTSGFFFGGTEYDKGYMDDIKNTVKQIKELLADEEKYNFKGDYFYHSSW